MVVLYIHGMGGGGDSRIPAILSEVLAPKGVEVVVRTYDFDPDKGWAQISAWVDELRPSLVVGESLGAIHAMRVKGLPHLFVSPSFGAPAWFRLLSFAVRIPGVASLMHRAYPVKEGDRQRLIFTPEVLKKFSAHYKAALENTPVNGSGDYFHAYFGLHDRYLRSGVVSRNLYTRYFYRRYEFYDGNHFMPDELVANLLAPKILLIFANHGKLEN